MGKENYKEESDLGKKKEYKDREQRGVDALVAKSVIDRLKEQISPEVTEQCRTVYNFLKGKLTLTDEEDSVLTSVFDAVPRRFRMICDSARDAVEFYTISSPQYKMAESSITAIMGMITEIYTQLMRGDLRYYMYILKQELMSAGSFGADMIRFFNTCERL